jgi:hypothetical protein
VPGGIPLSDNPIDHLASKAIAILDGYLFRDDYQEDEIEVIDDSDDDDPFD